MKPYLTRLASFSLPSKKQSPDTVTAIEKAPEQPLDYGKAVLEVESAAKANPEVNRTMQELAAAAKAEPNPKFNEILAMPNLQKLAEKNRSGGYAWWNRKYPNSVPFSGS